MNARRQTMMAALRPTLAAAQAFATTDFRPDIKSFDGIPTPIIYGTSDKTVPIDAAGRVMAQKVPGAKLIEYEGSAHGLFATDKDRLSADLVAFLTAESLQRTSSRRYASPHSHIDREARAACLGRPSPLNLGLRASRRLSDRSVNVRNWSNQTLAHALTNDRLRERTEHVATAANCAKQSTTEQPLGRIGDRNDSLSCRCQFRDPLLEPFMRSIQRQHAGILHDYADARAQLHDQLDHIRINRGEIVHSRTEAAGGRGSPPPAFARTANWIGLSIEPEHWSSHRAAALRSAAAPTGWPAGLWVVGQDKAAPTREDHRDQDPQEQPNPSR